MYCTLADGKRGWVSHDSLVAARPDLATAMHANEWCKLRGGERLKAKPLTANATWFRVVPPDAPDQPVHEPTPPEVDWGMLFRTCHERMSQLEADYRAVRSLLAVPASTASADEPPPFDLDAFVAQHSFAEVVGVGDASSADGVARCCAQAVASTHVGPFAPPDTTHLDTTRATRATTPTEYIGL